MVGYWIAGGYKDTDRPKEGLPLSPDAEREARARFLPHRPEQEVDAIRKAQHEMTDRPAERSGQNED